MPLFRGNVSAPKGAVAAIARHAGTWIILSGQGSGLFHYCRSKPEVTSKWLSQSRARLRASPCMLALRK